MDNIELQADIIGNSTTMLALFTKLPIRKRASSTHTDYAMIKNINKLI